MRSRTPGASLGCWRGRGIAKWDDILRLNSCIQGFYPALNHSTDGGTDVFAKRNPDLDAFLPTAEKHDGFINR